MSVALTSRMITRKGEAIKKPLLLAESLFTREALAKVSRDEGVRIGKERSFRQCMRGCSRGWCRRSIRLSK